MPGLQCPGDKSSNHTATQMFLNMHIKRYKALGHGKIYIFLPFSVCVLIATNLWRARGQENIASLQQMQP